MEKLETVTSLFVGGVEGQESMFLKNQGVNTI